jgi:tRNA nucleotidyltransferase (CCA-adding enzyme)
VTEVLAEPCNVVLTHTHADFDSLAGAVALAKVWSVERPEHPTHVVMPRGVNPLVARFLAYHKHLLPVRGFKTIREDDIRAVGVVDTQMSERVGPAAPWLDVAEHVAVYDHHVGIEGDIEPHEVVVEPVGSSTTVLVERLRALKESPPDGKPPLELTEADATLFALGIRADTGALSFPGTTPRDGMALVWLMEHGASQVAIAEFGQARLSAVQRDLLAEAMSSVSHTNHEGLKIGTVHLDTGRGFITGMAAVAEELLQLMSYDVLVVGVRHRNAKGQYFLSLIGRRSGRASAVDLNSVMGEWKGGGHPAAAAASLRLGGSGDEGGGGGGGGGAVKVEGVEAVLLEKAREARMTCEANAVLGAALDAILSQVPKQVTASEVMTRTVFSCAPGDTMEHALGLMRRVEKKAMPVVDEESGALQGMLKFRDVVKAMQSAKGGQQVKAWMRRELVTVHEDTPFTELEGMLQEQTGRLPVVDDDGVLLGIVTRTDVLRHHKLYGDELERRVS